MANASDVVRWLDAIMRHGVNTTTWEDEFVERLQSRVEMYGDRIRFTDLEAKKVEEIYSERCP